MTDDAIGQQETLTQGTLTHQEPFDSPSDLGIDDRPATPIGVMDPGVQAASGRGWGDASAGERSGSSRQSDVQAVPSAAAINGHPLHPMFVPVPIGLLAGTVASDVAYAVTGDRFWARAGLACTAGTLLSGAIAAAFGITDFVGRREIRDHSIAWLHAGGNVAIMGLGAVGLVARARNAERAAVPLGLGLSLVSGALVLATGWLGGELVYRHRIGVTPQ